MARKTKEETEATREGILDAAELCFLEQGVFRTTLEHIAARAGHTRGAVYWHFKNKLEVLHAVMDRVEVPIFTGLEQLAAEKERPLLALRAFYEHAFDEMVRTPHARNAIEITMLRCEYAEETKEIFARKRRVAAMALARIVETLRRAQRRGQLRKGVEPVSAARAIHFLVTGAVREWVLDPGKLSLPREGMAALDLLLDGIAAEGALGKNELRRVDSRRKKKAA
ncbi:MAG TPA: TetR family transcriptional regulator [Steroidobacter sp.]